MKTILFYNLPGPDSARKGVPFIQAARNLGFKTIVATHAEDPEMLCGDVNEIVPITEWQNLKQLILQYSVDFAMTVNCRLTPIIAELNQPCAVYNFPKESALIMTSKDKCADFINSQGLKAPRHWILKEDSDWDFVPEDIPIILKPSFSTGAIDTFRFSSAEKLRNTLSNEGISSFYLNRKMYISDFYNINLKPPYFGYFMIQEYIDYKRQIGLELLIVNGMLNLVHSALILTEEPNKINAYAHLGPVDVPVHILASFQKIISSLNIKNCHFSPDFLLDQNDNWFLIDANLNIGGEGLIDAIQARGLNYPEESLKAFFALPYSLSTTDIFSACYAKPSFSSESTIKIQTSSTFKELFETIKLARS